MGPQWRISPPGLYQRGEKCGVQGHTGHQCQRAGTQCGGPGGTFTTTRCSGPLSGSWGQRHPPGHRRADGRLWGRPQRPGDKPIPVEPLSLQELEDFTHTAKPAVCGLCPNRCNLTVNFAGAGKIHLRQPVRAPAGQPPPRRAPQPVPGFKLEAAGGPLRPRKTRPAGQNRFGSGENMYENLPFWHTFTQLGFEVVVSPPSTVELFAKGGTPSHPIPSATRPS